MMKKQSLTINLLLIAFLLLTQNAEAQWRNKFHDSSDVYYVNPWISGGIGLVGTIANAYGVQRILNKSSVDTDKILALTMDDVNGLDRVALRQDPAKIERYITLSDIGLQVSFALPLTLLFDKEIRSDWVDFLLLYIETQAISANVYSYSPLGPTFIERYRPRAYYDFFPLSTRSSGRVRNSFFSGHVSTSATGAFFAAKVLSDYHPEWGAKRIWLYAAALVPTAFVAYNRVVSLSHFPTDTMMGALVGAASAILIPSLHKRKQNRWGLSLNYSPDAKYFAGTWKF